MPSTARCRPAERALVTAAASPPRSRSGILNVTAKDKDTGATNHVSISNERGRLSDSEVDRMVAEAERFREQDELQRQQIEARNGLEGVAHQLSSIGREASRVEVRGDIARCPSPTSCRMP